MNGILAKAGANFTDGENMIQKRFADLLFVPICEIRASFG
jgi:hypothetical protein